MTNHDAAAAVAALAHTNLIRTLEQFSNDVGPLHSHALRLMLNDLSSMAYDLLRGRRAYPLGCGLGKTQGIVALCAALHALHSKRSVAISASKVESLCELKRHMISRGIPETSIGLTHAYKHEAGAPIGLSGWASLPSTTENDTRQFHLVSHQRVRNGTPVANYYTFNGKPRDLLIWDESLVVSDARTLSVMGLESAFGFMRPRVGAASPVMVYLADALDKLTAEVKRQKDGVPQPVELGALDGFQISQFKVELTTSDVATPLKQLLEMSQEALRVAVTAHGSGLVSYDIAVPRSLESIAVLDASWPIRELERLDKSIALGLDAELTASIKRYDSVQIYHLDAPAGRNTVTTDFKGNKLVCSEVCDVVRQIPMDQACIIWTFKEKKDWRERKVNFRRILENALTDAGVDIKATVPVTRWQAGAAVTENEPRLIWRTWGQECSDSAYAYACNQVFAGVLHRSYLDIAGASLGQKDEKWAKVENVELRRICLSEATHSILQALNRGSCRIIEGNRARAMKAWLFHRDANIRTELEKVMPGMQWLRWQTRYMCAGIGSRTVARIGDYLEGLSQGVKKVSVRAMKEGLGMGAAEATKTFTRSLTQYLGEHPDWEREGRSIVRTWDWSEPASAPPQQPAVAR